MMAFPELGDLKDDEASDENILQRVVWHHIDILWHHMVSYYMVFYGIILYGVVGTAGYGIVWHK